MRINDANAKVSLTNITVASSVRLQEGVCAMKYVGGFVGQLQSGKLTLNNCHFNGTIDFAKGTYLAGFVGMANSGTTLILNNCHGTGTISGKDYVAGLSGYTSTTTKKNNNSCLMGSYSCDEGNSNASFIELVDNGK